jgi:hypothetical protein
VEEFVMNIKNLKDLEIKELINKFWENIIFEDLNLIIENILKSSLKIFNGNDNFILFLNYFIHSNNV